MMSPHLSRVSDAAVRDECPVRNEVHSGAAATDPDFEAMIKLEHVSVLPGRSVR
jgi:hypothetical protein